MLDEKLAVSSIEVVVIEEVSGPCGAAYPESAGETSCQSVVESVGRRAGRQDYSSCPEHVFGVDFQPGDDRLDVRGVGQHEFGCIAHQHAGDSRRDVAVMREIAGP